MEIFSLLLISIFTVILALKYLVLRLKFRVNPFLIGKNTKTLYTRILETTPFVLTIILIFLTLVNFLNNAMQINSVFSYIGLFLGCFSFYFLILGYYHMGFSWRIGISNKIDTPLVTTGIFSITRNPVYIFFYLFYISIFLTTGNLIFLSLTILIFINLHLLILEEEKSLEKAHGKKYMVYKEGVPRYF